MALDESELLLRRKRVVAFTAQRLSQRAIGQLIGTDAATVNRDLAWMRKHWQNEYGLGGSTPRSRSAWRSRCSKRWNTRRYGTLRV